MLTESGHRDSVGVSVAVRVLDPAWRGGDALVFERLLSLQRQVELTARLCYSPHARD